MDRLSINTAPLTSYLKKKYYDLEATIYIMRMFSEEKVVDGFEFQLLAEWNPDYHPLNKDTKFDRELAWENSRKYRIEEIAAILKAAHLPILSVHANQDIGICLCAEEPELNRRGIQLIKRALLLAEKIDAHICVFHLWDPWLEDIDFQSIKRAFISVLNDFPTVKASVENIPVYSASTTPYKIVKDYPWITLDVKWALMYGELGRYKAVRDKIIDIHIHGRAQKNRWLFSTAHHTVSDILRTIEKDWDYHRLLTLDTEGSFENMKWRDLVAGISSLRISVENFTNSQ